MRKSGPPDKQASPLPHHWSQFTSLSKSADVYQGAPAPISGFLSAGPKAAAFAVFLRIFMTAFQPISRSWEPLVWLSALLSMTVGNFAALTQSNIKRMLAYSSIAH